MGARNRDEMGSGTGEWLQGQKGKRDMSHTGVTPGGSEELGIRGIQG